MANQKVILIAGFGGCGKTTVARILHTSFANSACVSADALTELRPLTLDDKLLRVRLRNCLDVIRNFLDEGFEHVVCDGLIWSQKELNAVGGALAGEHIELFVFWLQASKVVRFRRVLDNAQAGGGDTMQFWEHVESKLADPWPMTLTTGHVEMVETSYIDVQQTAKIIIERVAGKTSAPAAS
jgi:predicted kinase